LLTFARRLNDWDEDDVSVIPATVNEWDKVVVLKNLFTAEDLEEDEDADEEESMADFIIRDIREQCLKFGRVENAVLFDAEPEGVVTVASVTAVLPRRASRRCMVVGLKAGLWRRGSRMVPRGSGSVGQQPRKMRSKGWRCDTCNRN
jgi:hypothetical protein